MGPELPPLPMHKTVAVLATVAASEEEQQALAPVRLRVPWCSPQLSVVSLLASLVLLLLLLAPSARFHQPVSTAQSWPEADKMPAILG